MDRVSQTFTHATRLATIGISFIIAFALHLDAGALLQRMFSDSETRARLVASVDTLQDHARRLGAVPGEALPDGGVASESADGGVASGADAGAGAANPGVDEIRKAASELRTIRSELAASGIDILPKFDGPVDLQRGIHAESDFFFWKGQDESRHFLGIVAAGALLSLGAPFWFNLLSQLANLRTVLGNKEKAERGKPRTEAG